MSISFVAQCWQTNKLAFSLRDPARPAAEVCLEAASTFNGLLSKYRTGHSLPLSNPHLIYLIYTVAIAHLSGHRQLEDTSTTASLQTQLHLINCLEALEVIGQTWDLGGRCWRTLGRLMDVEGMSPGSDQTMGGGSMLGKRKRRDTSSLNTVEKQVRRENLDPSTTIRIPQDPLVSPQLSPHSSGSGHHRATFPPWPSSAVTSATPPSSITPIPTTPSTDIFFDPDFFSSNTGWMPVVHHSDSYEGIWNTSDWDENFWTRSLQMPLGVHMSQMDDNFTSEIAAPSV